MTLYEIDKAIQEALEGAVDPESGEIIDEELLAAYDQLRMDRDQKVENIGLYIKNLEADAAAIKAEAKNLTARAKAAENKAEHLRNYMQFCLNGQNTDCRQSRFLSLRTSDRCHWCGNPYSPKSADLLTLYRRTDSHGQFENWPRNDGLWGLSTRCILPSRAEYIFTPKRRFRYGGSPGKASWSPRGRRPRSRRSGAGVHSLFSKATALPRR